MKLAMVMGRVEMQQHSTTDWQRFSAETVNTLPFLELPELLTYELPPREIILSPWLTTQSLNMIYAPRGIGKTFMSMHIAYAVCAAGHFLGWQATRPQGVLFIDGEMPGHLLKSRFASIVNSSSYPQQAPLRIVSPDLLQGKAVMPDLSTHQGQAAINQLITEDIALIVLDNLSTLVRSGRENEAESWLPIQNWALQLRAQHKSVLFIHHAGRNGQARGTSRREDVLDTIISLQHPENYQARMGACFVVEFMKARHLHGEALQPFVAQLITQHGKSTWQTQAYQGSTYEQVIELANQGASQAEIIKQQGFSKATVYRHYHKGRAEGRIHT
jgi:DNA-binding CsgD family transcriptional regulator